ncbi:MAG: RnfABCDGE type electron transport complex subunit D, partial [Nitrospirota bacterium]|nr:RnfABCDGE type electron transport complex subunit D [Nitrospirota bacterium]
SPRAAPPARNPATSSAGDNGGISVSTILPCTFEITIEDEVLAKAFWITVIIRMWGGYPEGVSFAIVLMNIATPLIDIYTRPVRYGANRAEGTS